MLVGATWPAGAAGSLICRIAMLIGAACQPAGDRRRLPRTWGRPSMTRAGETVAAPMLALGIMVGGRRPAPLLRA